jgi:hypothetical protein
VGLTNVRRKRSKWPLTLYPSGYRRILSKGGKFHSDIPSHSEVLATISRYSQAFVATLGHSNSSEWASTLIRIEWPLTMDSKDLWGGGTWTYNLQSRFSSKTYVSSTKLPGFIEYPQNTMCIHGKFWVFREKPALMTMGRAHRIGPSPDRAQDWPDLISTTVAIGANLAVCLSSI